MRLLILGGTRFIGPPFVEAALARGYQVTLFNRRRTNPGRVKNVETLQGDRNGQLDALKDRQWDAVLDTSAFVPRIAPGRTTILRPGLIVGPDDNTDRFTYWPARVARGGEVMAPGTPPRAKLRTRPHPRKRTRESSDAFLSSRHGGVTLP